MRLPFASPQAVAADFQARGLPKKFCQMPFTTLILEPEGHVLCCRVHGTEFLVGDLKTQSFEEIWNGPKMRQWRREFLRGEPGLCQREVRDIGCNLCPQYNTLLPDVLAEEYQPEPPIRLGINLNGHCNLECQMCHIWRKPNGFYDEHGLWGKIGDLVAKVKEVELLSGEPFIQRDTFRLIDLISGKNPECLWSITTNSHWKLTDKIRSELDRIRFKHLIVSIDSLVPEAYAKIRKKGDLSVVLANFDRLLDYERSRIARGLGSMNIRISFLVQRDNWREVGAIHEFAREKGVDLFRIFLYEPAEYGLLSLPANEREQVLGFYLETLSVDALRHTNRTFLPLLYSLSPIARADYLLRLRERMGLDGAAAQVFAMNQSPMAIPSTAV